MSDDYDEWSDTENEALNTTCEHCGLPYEVVRIGKIQPRCCCESYRVECAQHEETARLLAQARQLIEELEAGKPRTYFYHHPFCNFSRLTPIGGGMRPDGTPEYCNCVDWIDAGAMIGAWPTDAQVEAIARALCESDGAEAPIPWEELSEPARMYWRAKARIAGRVMKDTRG
jgi:hypothetical protein